MKYFAVFGNPIKHSKSPIIHSLFSKQTGIKYDYNRICAPINSFSEVLKKFFLDGGNGANITLPFKEQAWTFADELSDRAFLSGSVNTLLKSTYGKIFGDNTDGIGLISDLKRLMMIHSNDHILLIGAGGAARAVILSLLSFGCSVVIVNRTVERAIYLTKIFKNQGSIQYTKFELLDGQHFDLIINATSSGISGKVPPLPTSLIFDEVRCYDMFYQQGLTPFLLWCQQNHAQRKNLADGLGMLVEQAAHAFQLWHGIMPKTTIIINQLQELI
ncbi:shikimate dehydrogenase [Pantoea sp. Mhis]|uniref:shikimate dehydrogenase n=1 Tax=Pantoea sp. Mhis TaxID=2576759 RepID=UPI001357B333|nr:shikimate dehydrogenase [Pantoea sp. Mhis]MXP56576.1 shikimate dehydrogenase [Pantoea sp. Mhis]